MTTIGGDALKIHEAIEIDKENEEPIYIQLYEGIKKLIDNGSISANDKLPPIRTLADKLQINNVTVVNAYKMLEQKGLVYSKVGSGTYVRGIKKDGQKPLEETDIISEEND
jgi:DNA-binding transcriptional regulator YhcF (GntR family)